MPDWNSLRRGSALTAIALCALLLGAATARASVVTYNGFASTAGLTLVGNTTATTTTSDGTVLRLTAAAGGQSGAAYSTSAVALGANATFSTTFDFRFTSPSSPPADGITFVLAASPTGLGGAGGGLGYQNVANSVAVEFDTYNNGAGDANSSNHVAIDTNGALTDTAAAFPYGVQSCTGSGVGCMSNGDLWKVTIGYDGTNLSVSLQDGSQAVDNLISNYAINIASDLGTNNAYVGFTGSTGGSYENQDITTWSFANTTQLAAPATVPEPSGLGVFAAGVAALGLVGAARRRRPG